jgi:hypothetical protein
VQVFHIPLIGVVAAWLRPEFALAGRRNVSLDIITTSCLEINKAHDGVRASIRMCRLADSHVMYSARSASMAILAEFYSILNDLCEKKSLHLSHFACIIDVSTAMIWPQE